MTKYINSATQNTHKHPGTGHTCGECSRGTWSAKTHEPHTIRSAVPEGVRALEMEHQCGGEKSNTNQHPSVRKIQSKMKKKKHFCETCAFFTGGSFCRLLKRSKASRDGSNCTSHIKKDENYQSPFLPHDEI